MSGIALQHFSAVMQLANASLSQFFLFFLQTWLDILLFSLAAADTITGL